MKVRCTWSPFISSAIMFLEAAIACPSFFSIRFTCKMSGEVIDRPQTANDLAQFIFGQGCIPRNDDNLSLFKLSQLCDVSYSTLKNAEMRGSQLGVPTIERICTALGVTLSDFFAESGRAYTKS